MRGAVLMVFAMAGFAMEDMFIKLMSDQLPIFQIILVLGFGGGLFFALLTLLKGQSLWSATLLHPAVILRGVGEIIGTLGFVSAIVLTPVSSASAILQATPLAVTLGAALFLQEQVGWRRWTAIIVGFCGVMLVLRPWEEGFELASLFAVQGVVGLALRDLATRRVPGNVSTIQLSTYGFLSLVPAGLIIMPWSEIPAQIPSFMNSIYISAALIFGILAYYAIVAAMRVGEVSFVTPFRYSRLIFAAIIGVIVFEETIDTLMLIGSAIIVGSGLFTVLRERRMGLSSSRKAR
nr:DMT family transporter [Pseudaestuariivita rosea]